MSILMLTEDEVRQVLTMELALEAVENALRKLAIDEAENVPRHRVRTDHVMLHVMSASAKTLGCLGYKAYVTSKKGAHFTVGLYDGKTGELISLMQADYLGQVRTGAASGVATKHLARPDASTVGIFGSGKQAKTQLEAICQVRDIRQARVYSPTPENRKSFAEEMSAKCQTEVIPAETPDQAARGMDIISTATTSREPVLLGEWLAEGTHVNAIGSNFRGKAEIDPEAISRSTCIAVDSKDQARMEAGDFFPAIDAGVLQWSDVHDLGQILVGRFPGRERDQDITLFKSLGLAIEDVAVAMVVYEKAKENGLGRDWEW